MNGVSSARPMEAAPQQLAETAGMSDAVREELAWLLVELVRKDGRVQKAVLELLWSCPNVVTRI